MEVLRGDMTVNNGEQVERLLPKSQNEKNGE